jgi:hypothetical protein
MTEERTTPLRERMIEDMRIRGMGDKHQKSHIRAIKDFASFLGRSPSPPSSPRSANPNGWSMPSRPSEDPRPCWPI